MVQEGLIFTCSGGFFSVYFFFKSSSSLHVAWAAITAAQGSVSEAINTLSGQLLFPVERGCWGMHWIHISPHKLLHPLCYLPSDLPSHSRGRRLGLPVLLQTPSSSALAASIQREREAGGTRISPSNSRSSQRAPPASVAPGCGLHDIKQHRNFLIFFLCFLGISVPTFREQTWTVCMLQSPKIHGFHNKSNDTWYGSNFILNKTK